MRWNYLAVIAGVLAPVLVLSGCWTDVTEPTGGPEVTLLVRADVSATSAATLVVEVTAPDITTPLTFNIPIDINGIATGTVTVTAGSDRTFVMRAFDAGGVETHNGSTTVDVRPGVNPTITIVLVPATGEQPIDATLGTVTVEVTPAADTLTLGVTTTLVATVRDAVGDPVAVQVSWATLGPIVATVDSTGLVTAQGVGETTVVATFAGVGDGAAIVVSADPQLQLVASGLSNPLYVTAPPDDTTRVFIVEQSGKIRVMRNDTLLATPFLDITSLVTFGGERGLLGLAFHPDYSVNGQFFVDYIDKTGTGNTQVVRYTVSANPDLADQNSAQAILSVTQPLTTHNGGLVQFGPDGMLYIGLGDGGGSGDPGGNGQDSSNVLGTILRIDVDGGSPYAIPVDNPFNGHATARGEIWVYGLRNPWRFSFDRLTGNLYVADVGQNSWEEVDIQLATSSGGENYGWNTMEGFACFNPSTGCNQTGLVLPDYVYGHSGALPTGCSITGGSVYRGTKLPALVGRYFYADFCSGWVRSFRFEGGLATDDREEFASVGSITSFGEDAKGELYVVTQEANIYRMTPQ